MKKLNKTALALTVAAIFLQGCGSDSEQAKPTFSLAVSDAPVESALTVVACFSQIELKSSNSDNDETFLIGQTTEAADENVLCTDDQGATVPNTRGIDLLSFTGADSTPLLSDIEINPGEYNQIRLVMSPYSYVTVDLDGDGTPERLPVRVPSNELKLDGFTATLGGETDLTVEFDLRKGMTNPVGQEGYILKPRGVRLVDNITSGHIEGTVSEALLSSNSCEILEDTIASVYVYAGTGLDAAELADNGGAESIESLTSTSVNYDGAGNYAFEIGFVRSGDYTLALTCDVDADPEGDDEVAFIAIVDEGTTVGEGGAVTTVSFTVAE